MASRTPYLFGLLTSLLLTPLAHGAPTLGFVEHWPGTAVNGWGGGASASNPGSGGVGGSGDGFLMVSSGGGSLGVFSSGAEYSGDWVVAGILQVRFWLNDVGTDDPLEMHFAIGNAVAGGVPANIWQYDTGFIPPLHAWGEFTVNLSTSAGFTHIINNPPGGTFEQALQDVNRVLIRHDNAPYSQFPDAIAADVGIDDLFLTTNDIGVPIPGPSVSRPIQLDLPYPNPSRGPVALSLQAFEDAPITIQIVDVTGRLVRQTTLSAAPAGSRIWTWDGATETGESAPAGYYRARAFGPSGGTSRPFIRLP